MKAGEDWIRERELSHPQAFVLGYLAQHPGAIQRDIGQLTRTSPASVSSLMQGLERRGLVQRRTEDGNERSKRVYPTPDRVALIAGFVVRALVHLSASCSHLFRCSLRHSVSSSSCEQWARGTAPADVGPAGLRDHGRRHCAAVLRGSIHFPGTGVLRVRGGRSRRSLPSASRSSPRSSWR